MLYLNYRQKIRKKVILLFPWFLCIKVLLSSLVIRHLSLTLSLSSFLFLSLKWLIRLNMRLKELSYIKKSWKASWRLLFVLKDQFFFFSWLSFSVWHLFVLWSKAKDGFGTGKKEKRMMGLSFTFFKYPNRKVKDMAVHLISNDWL